MSGEKSSLAFTVSCRYQSMWMRSQNSPVPVSKRMVIPRDANAALKEMSMTGGSAKVPSAPLMVEDQNAGCCLSPAMCCPSSPQ